MDIEQARLLAKDENTKSIVLAQLADSRDYQTVKNVASNPNTSPEILLKLSKYYSYEVMKNPVLPLLSIEKPYFFVCKLDDAYYFRRCIFLINMEFKRLAWNRKKGRDYLFQQYGKRSRSDLSNKELFDFLSSLSCL